MHISVELLSVSEHFTHQNFHHSILQHFNRIVNTVVHPLVGNSLFKTDVCTWPTARSWISLRERSEDLEKRIFRVGTQFVKEHRTGIGLRYTHGPSDHCKPNTTGQSPWLHPIQKNCKLDRCTHTNTSASISAPEHATINVILFTGNDIARRSIDTWKM